MHFVTIMAVALASRTLTRTETQTAMKVPAFDSVITMLQNLVTQIETEVASDETDYNNFMTWFNAQSATTSASIGSLSSRLQELAAILADLRSRKNTLSTEVARLNGEIDQTQTAIQEATAKRKEEHESFVQEQLDFDNSIAACNKAVELLQAHYGDGTPKESTRPAWMSMLQELQKVKVVTKKHLPQLTALLEAAQTPGMVGSTMHTQYEGRTDEALGIVGQVQQLAATFAEDKQSSIDQENELQEGFETLIHEKQQQLAILIQQRDQQQSVLNQVNQEIGENESAEQTAKSTLVDEQAFLSMIQQQERDTTSLYSMRQKDRVEEKQAVSKAIGVLTQEAPSLMELKSVTRRIRLHRDGPCLNCNRAALLLKQSASRLHSELLATAAMTTGSGEALVPVIGQLTDLVRRLDEQQHAEEEHKQWCENELSETNKQKTHHEMLVEQFKQHIEETQAVIAEKKQSIADTLDAIKTADDDYKEAEGVRAKEKQDYEAEHADYVDAINALNQAIDILADFYRESFVQEPMSFIQQPVSVPGASSKMDVPQMQTLSGGYVKKGGGAVVAILKTTRQDFTAGQHHLEQEEDQAVKDFADMKAAYEKSRGDLVDAGNQLNAELQTASMALAQYQSDLASNEEKVMSLTSYLAQVGGSCNMLISNFGERTRMRNEEKESISQAIGILQQAQ